MKDFGEILLIILVACVLMASVVVPSVVFGAPEHIVLWQGTDSQLLELYSKQGDVAKVWIKYAFEVDDGQHILVVSWRHYDGMSDFQEVFLGRGEYKVLGRMGHFVPTMGSRERRIGE